MSIIYTDKPLPKRFKNDLYPTPVDFCRASVAMLPNGHTKALDPGAGLGAWGKALREKFGNSLNLTGVDIDTKLEKSKYYDNWVRADYLKVKTDEKFDLIIGNPPYSHAEEFVRRSFDLLDKTGTIMFLLRLAFLESQERGNGLWKTNKPTIVFVSSKRLSFTGNRKSDNTAYGLFVWHSSGGYWQTPSMLDWLEWNYKGDVVYVDIDGLRLYNVIDNYFIDPNEGDIYYVEDYKSART